MIFMVVITAFLFYSAMMFRSAFEEEGIDTIKGKALVLATVFSLQAACLMIYSSM